MIQLLTRCRPKGRWSHPGTSAETVPTMRNAASLMYDLPSENATVKLLISMVNDQLNGKPVLAFWRGHGGGEPFKQIKTVLRARARLWVVLHGKHRSFSHPNATV